MRNFQRLAAPVTADDDGVAQAQTTGAAADLLMNGAAVKADDGTAAYDIGSAVLDPPRRIQFTSVGNLSARTFTVYGTDRIGSPLVEAITGPNNATVTSNYLYKTVSRIAVSGAVGTAVKVGWSTEHITPWVFMGNMQKDAKWRSRVFFAAGSTINYALETTSKNVLRDRVLGDYVDDIETLVDAQIDPQSFDLGLRQAIRLRVNSSNALVTMRVQPSVTV